MNRLPFFALFLCTVFSLPLAAQRTLTGKVTDYDSRRNQPLEGVSVSVEGTAAITRTDAAGKYSLPVPATAKALLFSLPGYASARVELTAGNVYDITLKRTGPVIKPETETVAAPLLPPVDTIPIALILNEFGQIELSQILTFSSPLFQSNRQTLAGASDHVDPVQLRGLASDQLLVLVNGKRWHQSALVHTDATAQRGMAQGVDWNAIPASAVERVEVSRDVALGQYGSDAVAGVVNIVLKNKTGLDANVSYGQRMTRYDKNYALWKLGEASQSDVSASDGQSVFAGLHYGFDLGGRGSLNLTGEYLSRGATNRAGTYTGQISRDGLDDSLALAQAGLTREDFDMQIGEARMRGGAAMYNLDLNLNDNWSLYSFGGFSAKNGQSRDYYRYPSVIESDALTAADGFVLPAYPNGFLPEINSRNLDLGASIGVQGKMGDWTLDLCNNLGQNKLDFDVAHSINYTEVAITQNNPQTVFDAGGLKLFQNTANLEVARRFETLFSGLRLAAGLEHRMESFGVSQGEKGSYANYLANQNVGLLVGSQGFAGFDDSTGSHSRNSAGLYVRADQDFSPQFTLSATARFDRYSGFGNAFGGKLMLQYRANEIFALHAAAGTGFRAPSAQQEFYGKTANRAFQNFPGGFVIGQTGIYPNAGEPTQLFGVGELAAEKNTGFSLGLSLKPTDGMLLTLDAWQVSVKDRLILTHALDGRNNGLLDSTLNQLGIASVSYWDNAISTNSFGVEAGFSWKKSIDERQKIGLGLNAAFFQTKLKTDANDNPEVEVPDIVRQTDQIGAYLNLEDRNRFENALPATKIIATLNYGFGAFGADVRASWFGGTTYQDPINGRDDNLFNGGQVEMLNQDFGAKTVLDLSLSYAFVKGVQVTLGAHNLLDTYPDLHSHSTNMSQGRILYSTQAQQFGFAGRLLFARVKIDL